MSKTKTTSKKPDFVRKESPFVGGKNVDRYYAFYGAKKVRITKAQFERHLGRGPNIAAPRHRGKRKITLSNGEKTEVSTGWPMKCEALAVHPRQVERMNARNKRHGVNVSYDPKWGTAIIPDNGAYKRLQKLEGVRPN